MKPATSQKLVPPNRPSDESDFTQVNSVERLQGIKSWPVEERPRERLLHSGAETLSDAELLAVLLRNGTQGKDAVTWARELLTKTGGLRGLLSLDPKALLRFHGLGQAKITSLLAAKEMVRRQLREEIVGKNLLNDPESVLSYLSSSLQDKKREVFKVLFLNKAHELVDEINLCEGTVDGTAVYPREIVKAALDRHATALILVHNHPSGQVEPSPEDRELTRKLEEACSHLAIKVLDHLIVGGAGCFSFHEKGLIN